MQRTWLILAFCWTLPACFGAHGTGDNADAGVDAGSSDGGRDAGLPSDGGTWLPSDGGMCLSLPAIVQSMRCADDPRSGPLVAITTSPNRCCSSGTVTPTLSRTGMTFDVALEWDACDCCEGCRCIGPTEEVEVALGPLPPGRYTVQSEGSSCVLDVWEPRACSVVNVDEVRMPTVLFDDQPFAMTLLERDASSCSCQPHASFDGSQARMDICDCCDVCDCIDRGYETSVASDPLPLGSRTISTSLGPRSLTVVTREQCGPLVPTGLRIVSPDPTLRSSGPAIHWAVVAGTERLCCAPPAPAVDQGVGPAGQISLALHSCVQADCNCLGEEVAFEAWHPLVALPAGTHVIRAGTFEQTITIP